METPKGHSYPSHYQDFIDLMVNAHVLLRPYEDRRDIAPLHADQVTVKIMCKN